MFCAVGTEPLVDSFSLCRQAGGGLHDCFELDGGQLPESALTSSAVVTGFDPVHDREPEVIAVSQDRWLRTIFCSRLNQFSMAALSAHAPTRPIDP